jgi:hypothetical protein
MFEENLSSEESPKNKKKTFMLFNHIKLDHAQTFYVLNCCFDPFPLSKL